MYPVMHVPAGDVLPIMFSTYAGATGASITLTGLAVTDIEIYRDGSVTQRASDAGYTLLDTDGIDFDGITGIHGFSIDTGDNTDAGFYTVGAWFTVVVSAVTVDSQTVNFIAAMFRIVPAESSAGVPDVRLADAVSHGGTLGSSTATLALSRLNVTSQTSNTAAITATGNGTGNGATISSGSGATGTGLAVSSAATNGTAVTLAGAGSGNGMTATGGATGHGISGVGGATSGNGIRAAGTAGNSAAMNLVGQGSAAGLLSTGGATGHGISAVGGATSGSGLSAAAATSGTGITATGVGTSQAGIVATGGSTSSNGITATGGGTGHGIAATSGGGATGNGLTLLAASTNGHGLKSTGTGTGDGAELTAGASGADLDADMTGNITGNLSGSAGSVTGAVGSVTGNVGGNVTGTIGGLTAAALKDFFDTDSTTTYASAVAGSVVKEIADNAGGSALTAAAIADAVWDEAQADHVGAGSFGEIATETAAILVDTAEIGAAGAGLTALATQASVNTIDDLLDTEIGALTTELAKVPKSDGTATWNATALASLQQEATDALNAYDPPTKAELDSGLAAADDAVLAAIAALNNISVANILAGTVEGSTTLVQTLRLLNAALGGKASGLETTTAVYRDIGDTKDRITATVDADGNRSAVTLDLT